MKHSSMDLLHCPRCKAALSLRDERGDGNVDEGSLFCSQCERSFPIKNGVACFVDSKEVEDLDRGVVRFYDWFSHVYNLFNTVIFTGQSTTAQFNSPTDMTLRNNQYNADGSLNTSRLQPRSAGFGAANNAHDLREVQLQFRFEF